MQYKPRTTHIIIDPEPAPRATGAIVLPEELQMKPRAAGLVVAVGPQVREVEVGDTVHFERFEWSEINGAGHILIREDEVLAVET